MFTFRNLFSPSMFLMETPDPSGGVGGAGTAVPGTALPGQGQPQQGQAGFRQHFPNVPDEHWALIEPHIGQVEAHTTQLQQQLAPLQPILDAGYTPQSLQGLVSFDQKFNANPLQTWLELGNMLQQSQNGAAPAIHPDVDLEYLAAIARGQDPDAGSVPGTQPGADPSQVGDPQYQQLMAQLQAQQQEIASLKGGFEQERVQRETSVQDQLYARRTEQMKQALVQGGWPEELVTEEMMGSAIIMHRGDFAKAAKALLDQRSAMLKGFTQNRQTDPPPTNLPNGAPSSPTREPQGRNRNDPWKAATRNAEARLKRSGGQG